MSLAPAKRRTSTDYAGRQGASRKRLVFNAPLLLWTVLVLAIGSAAVFLLYQRQSSRLTQALLQRAEEEAKEENWSKSANYLRQYIAVKPDDVDALGLLADRLAKDAKTPQQLFRVNAVLYRILGLRPEDYERRLLLAENLLALRNFSQAVLDLRPLRESPAKQSLPPEFAADSQRIYAISQLAIANEKDAAADLKTAFKEVESALRTSPENVQLVEAASYLLRSKWDKLGLKSEEAADLADAAMNSMVAADPQNVDALLSRYRYRSQFQIAGADQDLEAAIALQPDHYQTLLLKSSRLTAGSPNADQLKEGESIARRAIEVAPDQPGAYLLLAKLLERRSEYQDAADTLKKGLQSSTQDNFSLALLLPPLLVRSGNLDEAEIALSELDKLSREYLPQLTAASRRPVERQIALVQYQVAIARGDGGKLIDQLQALQQELRSRSELANSTEAFQATQLLAVALATDKRWDAAGRLYQELADMIQKAGIAQPQNGEIRKLEAEARLAAAQAMLNSKQYDAAIANLTRQVELSGPSKSSLANLVMAHLRRQLTRPASERQWSAFQTELERAKKAYADSGEKPDWSLTMAEVEYLANQLDPSLQKTDADSRKQAIQLVKEAEGRFQDDAEFWRNAAKAYQRLDDLDALANALANYKRVEKSFSQAALFEAAMLTQAGKSEEAEASLTRAVAEANSEEKTDLELARAKLLIAGGRVDEAQTLVDDLLGRNPKNTSVLQACAELALLQRKWQAAEQFERQLAEQLGSEHVDVELLRARRLASNFVTLSPAQRQELTAVLTKLRKARPAFIPVISLAARVAAMSNNHQQALADFRTAIELGDASIDTLQAYVDLLAKCGEFDEAQKQLAKLESMAGSDDRIESFAIGLALQRNQIPQALQRAREAVAQEPSDPARRIWLASVLVRAGQREAAEEEFERVVQEFPKNASALATWFGYLFETKQIDRARQVLQQMTEQLDLEGPARSFVLGQCHEKLGDLETARTLFESAVKESPQNVAYRLRLANLLLSTDVAAARNELEQILTIDPSNADARRKLATLLAASGTKSDWGRITEILHAAGGESLVEDERLRALLLAQKGQSRTERIENTREAAKIVTALIERPENATADLDRLLLAGILEQEAMLANRPSAFSDARRAMLPLVERAKVSPEMLRLHVSFLLRALKSDVLSELTDDERKKLEQVFLTDADSRIKQLRLAAGDDPEAALENLPLETAVLDAKGDSDQGVALLRESEQNLSPRFATDNQKASFYLQLGRLYSSLKQHQAAQESFRKLVEIAPGAYTVLATSFADAGNLDAAIELFFDAAEKDSSPAPAVSLAQFLASHKYDGPRLAAANELLERATLEHSGSVPLLLSMGVLAVERGQIDLAIDFFRRVATLEPQNALALNNLATLLGENSANRDEALDCIERAIAVEGRKAPLLDTRGTIYLLAGDYAKAIESLEEAVAGGSFDPRYDFHLAVAYLRANRREDAARSFDVAQGNGIGSAMLTENDQQLLEELSAALANQN